MTYRGFVSRAEAGLRRPRSVSRSISPVGVTAHWMGGSPGIRSHSQCAGVVRGIQDAHMDRRGYVDLAYTMLACPHGWLFAGRGAGIRTAANGTNAGNFGWYAICGLLGAGDRPTGDMLDAWWAGRDLLRRQGGAGARVNEHADHKPTACAGTLGDAVKAGRPPTPKPTPKPTPPKEVPVADANLYDSRPVLFRHGTKTYQAWGPFLVHIPSSAHADLLDSGWRRRRRTLTDRQFAMFTVVDGPGDVPVAAAIAAHASDPDAHHA